MEDTAILNYPGSKRRLLSFIYDNSREIINTNKKVLDIFAGTGCVSDYFKRNQYSVIANDIEIYSCNISNTILNGFNTTTFNFESFICAYNLNKRRLINTFQKKVNEESNYINSSSEELVNFDSHLPKAWQLPEGFVLDNVEIKTISDLNEKIHNIPFALFTLYYSGSYFGLLQSIEIDSLRYAIEKANAEHQPALLTCLYYAMKEATFSKDGHMAQPLDHVKNFNRLINSRNKDILDLFLKEYEKISKAGISSEISEVRQQSFLDLINDEHLMEQVGFIYADPPYTDMQYSRYFHLLTTVSHFCYPELTLKNGKLTVGLYAENRFQSSISNHAHALSDLTKLMHKASELGIPLMFSYAYPVDRDNQPVDRYTMNIDDLIANMKKEFETVNVVKENFQHCNNRNSSSKKVYEYLVLGLPKKHIKNEKKLKNLDWSTLKGKIASVKATNKSSLYNTMLYWSQKPYNITDVLISELSQPGQIVFDPFMGSGVTLLEASNLINNRKAIGVDINDFPIFLCKNSVKIPTEKSYESLNKFKEILKAKNGLYATKCVHCGNVGVIKKIIYDIEPQFVIHEIEYDCSCSKHSYSKKASEADYEAFGVLHDIKHIQNIPLIENSRIAVKGGETISDKFSRRSFFALDEIKGLIEQEEDTKTKDILWYIYASIIHKSKILDVKLSSQWPLWIPKKNCVERNVFELFISALERYCDSRSQIALFYRNIFVDKFEDLNDGQALIIQKGIQNINESEIPSNSVDLVITDPPYLGQVPYSEYMQLYKPFLNTKINFEDEIVITNAKGREKDYCTYFQMMESAFSNISRIMKEEAVVCLYFHDSDLSVWRDLIYTFVKTGLMFETCMHIDKSQKTLKKILDPKKTMSGETLLFLRKRTSSISIRPFNNEDIDNIRIIAERTVDAAKSGKATTSQLYDNGVMNYIINEGILESLACEYHDLTDIFIKVMNYDSEFGVWSKKTI